MVNGSPTKRRRRNSLEPPAASPFPGLTPEGESGAGTGTAQHEVTGSLAGDGGGCGSAISSESAYFTPTDVEAAKEKMHLAVAANVEALQSVQGDRFVTMSSREEETDMSLATLEAIYLGQAGSVWKGVPFGKSAFDWQMYATLIHELAPGTIIDLGTWAGGSALFYADMATTLCGERFTKVVSVDITLKCVRSAARQDEKIELCECSTENLKDLFSADFVARCPRPWLVSEDAHYHFDRTMALFHEILRPGDYLVVEDTSKLMHHWFASNNEENAEGQRQQTDLAISQLRAKARTLRDYCCKYPDHYLVDTKYTDMFGYNVGKHWNSVIKRVA
eukprot:TRINITY_DN49446_c0_g1_i1.p1 TRINITY_DN49446_c0_g1~~TRINITY_DN49446_c0_g1_i1.p1  ORF type:complete len:334 (+),score=38.50 TRINITY_DN49446_c0_g1_i1:277-1278(+)